MSDLTESVASPDKRKWVVIGGGVVAAYLVYHYYKSKSANSTAGTPSTTTTTDPTIDPTTGIPYSEEYGTAGAYGAIPSGLTFNAQTGQFQPAASTIVGSLPYSSNTGQSSPLADGFYLARNGKSAWEVINGAKYSVGSQNVLPGPGGNGIGGVPVSQLNPYPGNSIENLPFGGAVGNWGN